MNKKIWMLLVLSVFLTTASAFAAPDYQERNVFNKVTDWSATMWKPAAEKQQVIDQRVDRRAAKRKAHYEYNEKKRDLTNDYKKELLSISNEDVSAQEMAQKLKDASENHKTKLRELKKDQALE